MNSIANKNRRLFLKIFVLISLFIFALLVFLVYFLGLNAYEKDDHIILSSNSLNKRLNIMQVYNNDYPAIPYLVKPVAFDKYNRMIFPNHDFYLGAENANFIMNLEYSRIQIFNLEKDDVNNFIKQSYDVSQVSKVRIFWGVNNEYFPVSCKWGEHGVYNCVKE